MEAKCYRCGEVDEGMCHNPWEFVCTRCDLDEEWIQGICAMLDGHPEPMEVE